jgi:hypothetical protein
LLGNRQFSPGVAIPIAGTGHRNGEIQLLGHCVKRKCRFAIESWHEAKIAAGASAFSSAPAGRAITSTTAAATGARSTATTGTVTATSGTATATITGATITGAAITGAATTGAATTGAATTGAATTGAAPTGALCKCRA